VKFGKYLLHWLYRMNVHAKPEASVCVYNYGGVEPSNLWLWAGWLLLANLNRPTEANAVHQGDGTSGMYTVHWRHRDRASRGRLMTLWLGSRTVDSP